MSVDIDLITDEASSELTELDSSSDTDIVEKPDDLAEDTGAGFSWVRFVAYGLLPALALLLALGAGYLKWLDASAREGQSAAEQSVRAATDGTVALLSYRADSVDGDLSAAADRLTGGFRDEYHQLVTSVVAPGSKEQHISAAATVPSAASVTASDTHAVVLVYVDQTTTVGNDPPTQSTSCVRVTLDKVDGRWLISKFDPV
ncbi:MAG: Mce-associated rane protein [Mycobacterium sp.]|jgi:Mce-associated membrane protein|nr:Mce-associated rane protein [Mycobacterium sp.]